MSDLATLEHSESSQPLALTALILSIVGRNLLIPNTAVAELIAWQPVDDLPGGVQKKDGLVGRIAWRGLQVPLVSFEVLAGDAEPDVTEATRIAILNSLDPSAGLSFYAVLLQAIPRPVQINAILQTVSQNPRPGEQQLVQLDGQLLAIPALEELEQTLIRSRLQQRF